MRVDSVSLHFLTEHPKEAARALEQFSAEQLSDYLSQLPASVVAELCKHIVPSMAADCLRRMPLDKSAPVITQMGIERATLLLRRMKSGLRVQYIRAMSPVLANMARLVLRYPEGTVGRVMNPHVFTVYQEMTAEEVINAIKKTEQLLQNVVFIINDENRLVGTVDLRLLLTADPSQSMKELMQSPGETVPARTSLRHVTQRKDWDTNDYFPVTDHLGSFIGVLQRADVYSSLKLDRPAAGDEEFTGTALALAELFWDACANLLVPEYPRSSKDKKDE